MRSIFRCLALVAPLTLGLANTVTAAPWGGGVRHRVGAAMGNIVCPLSNGTADLPGPDPLILKAISVGRGTQNYTCTPSSPSAAPVAAGATALLLDATPALPWIPSDVSLDVFAHFSTWILPYSRQILQDSALPKDGVHYFDAGANPVFDLTRVGLGAVITKKVSSISAPANSTQGPHGAVDWLELDLKDPPAANAKVHRVYRVNTASGKAPPTCEGLASMVTVDYAALYYFYGPA